MKICVSGVKRWIYTRSLGNITTGANSAQCSHTSDLVQCWNQTVWSICPLRCFWLGFHERIWCSTSCQYWDCVLCFRFMFYWYYCWYCWCCRCRCSHAVHVVYPYFFFLLYHSKCKQSPCRYLICFPSMLYRARVRSDERQRIDGWQLFTVHRYE